MSGFSLGATFLTKRCHDTCTKSTIAFTTRATAWFFKKKDRKEKKEEDKNKWQKKEMREMKTIEKKDEEVKDGGGEEGGNGVSHVNPGLDHPILARP